MKTATCAPQAGSRNGPLRQTERVRGQKLDPLFRIKTIVVSLDFSRASMQALSHAILFARKFKGTIHLVHVQSADEACVVPDAGHLMRKCAEIVASGRDLPSPALDRAKWSSFWPENCHLRTGQPYQQICELAREIDADLIVLATRGRTGLKRILLGSTAERVVRFAACPVLIVRHRKGSPAKAGLVRKGSDFRRILVPVDFSSPSLAALQYAASLARTFEARLLLFHALFPATRVTLDRISADTTDASAEVFQKDAELNMEALTQLDFMEGIKCETQVRWGYAIDEICRISSHSDIDLLVTSTHGRSGLKHVLIGSVAEHVTRYAECPVLVVPAPRALEIATD